MSPIKKFKAGGIQVAVWENSNKEGGKFNTVSLDRRYKDKEDNWKSTSSMHVNDLPKAILALEKAYEFLALQTSNGTEAE